MTTFEWIIALLLGGPSLNLAGVPYIGAGVAGSALAMDKDLFKKVMRDSGIPVARHHTIRLGDEVSCRAPAWCR